MSIKIFMKKICLLSFVIILTGCIPDYSTKQPAEVASAVKVKDSTFDSEIQYRGPQITDYEKRGWLSDQEYYFLRSWRDRSTGFLHHQLYQEYIH